MKQVIDLRPVYHRREDRIRAHVILCWLGLLLIRVAENTAGQTWNKIRAELQRQHAVTWTGPAGTFRQATDLTKLGLDGRLRPFPASCPPHRARRTPRSPRSSSRQRTGPRPAWCRA